MVKLLGLGPRGLLFHLPVSVFIYTMRSGQHVYQLFIVGPTGTLGSCALERAVNKVLLRQPALVIHVGYLGNNR